MQKSYQNHTSLVENVDFLSLFLTNTNKKHQQIHIKGPNLAIAGGAGQGGV